MTTSFAVLGQFGDAIDFIFHERESRGGGVQVGGHNNWPLIWESVKLTAASVSLASLIAIPPGLWLGHTGRGAFLATSVANIGRAVPTLALLAFFIAYLGVGFKNVTAALTLLALPPILTNTYVGVRQVDRDTVDAARGVGLTGFGIVRRVELPLALPTVFGGLRTSVVNVVATTTIAPLAGLVTIGDPIINAQIYGEAGRLGASIIVAAMAVTAEVVFAMLQRAVTPRGLLLQDDGARARRSWFVIPTRRKVA
jgi:osmoprotectant transport system permease protein